MSLLARAAVTPFNAQIELSDPGASSYPQWQSGEEAVVALRDCIAVATQGDQDGKVSVEVWSGNLDLDASSLSGPLFDGEFVTTMDHVVIGNTIGNELFEVALPRGKHRVQVFTSPSGGLPNRVSFLIDSVDGIGEKRTLPGLVSALTVAAFAALAPTDALAWVERRHNAVDWLTEKRQLLPLGTPDTVLTFDANGNRIGEGTRQYTWDIRDTLTAVTDGAVTLGQYDYDSGGQRVKADTSSGHVEYVLDGKYVLRESGARTRRYHYGEGRGLAVNDGAGSRWLLEDGLGSTSAEVSANASTVTARQYDAWGNYRNGTAPTGAQARLGYTGHQFDVESGLIYARNRYYDPVEGTFLSRDEMEGSLSDAPSLHRYAYAHSNPLRYTDPDGRDVGQAERLEREYDVEAALEEAQRSGAPTGSTRSLVGTPVLERTAPLEETRDQTLYRGYLKQAWSKRTARGLGSSTALELAAGPVFAERRVVESKVMGTVLRGVSSREQLSMIVAGTAAQDAPFWNTQNEYAPDEWRLMQLGAPESETRGFGEMAKARDLQLTGYWLIGLSASVGLAAGGAAEQVAAINAEKALAAESKLLANITQRAELQRPTLFKNLVPEDVPRPPNVVPNEMLSRISGKFAYVVTEEGELVVGRSTQFQGHIDLAAGRPVQAAGEMKVVRGELRFIDNKSGHYQPSGPRAQRAAESAFERAGLDPRGTYVERKFK